ncbi:MAG: glycosyltransferase family 2 protein [Candidatus Marinimicrobia bacterium]|nr:glycosyltransferase family 2 protein [Candidatus Neomarinimicrobiota bacterium]
MKKSSKLVIVVVYPGVEKFLKDYFSTILFQIEHDFDLLILNDQANLDISKICHKRIKIINIEDKMSFAQIRYEGILYGIQNQYETIIFTDADDYYSKNRISLSEEMLKNYSFVFNEIELVDSKKKKIRSNVLLHLGVKMEYDNIDEIIDKNYFGLSNTAVNVKEIKSLYIPKDIIAVDWWIFTVLLLNGCKGRFIKEVKTYYRQSEINLVGFCNKLNEKRLMLGIKVKTNHYKNLIEFCEGNHLEKEKLLYKRKLDEMKELKYKLKNPGFRERYMEVINYNYDRIFCGWWSEILPINKWSKYA